jgi:hypothetical protein
VADSGALDRAVRWVLSGAGIFLISSSDARLLRPALEAATAAAAGATPPDDRALEADMRDLAIEPLFDGDALERI